MLLENAVRTHAFNKVSSSELQAGQQHEATEPLPSSSHPGQRPRETWTGPGPGLAVGSKSSRLPGPAQPGCTTSRLPGATGLDWFPTSNVEIHSPGPHTLWGLLSACNGWAMDLLYQTINVLLICYPLWRHNAQVTHTVRGRKPPREQASECDGGTPALRQPRGKGCGGRARPPRSPCLQDPRPPRHSSPLGWPYTRTLQPVGLLWPTVNPPSLSSWGPSVIPQASALAVHPHTCPGEPTVYSTMHTLQSHGGAAAPRMGKKSSLWVGVSQITPRHPCPSTRGETEEKVGCRQNVTCLPHQPTDHPLLRCFIHPFNHAHYAPTRRQALPGALGRRQRSRQTGRAPGVEGGRYSQLRGPGQNGRHGEQDASVGARFKLGRGEGSEPPSGLLPAPLPSSQATP